MRTYIDEKGRTRKAKWADLPEAWIEPRDPEDDDCQRTYIDERGLYVKCSNRALLKRNGKEMCRKCFNAA